MSYFMSILAAALTIILHASNCRACQTQCPPHDTEMVCGYDVRGKMYTMFPSECAMTGYMNCHKVDLVQTPITFCIKAHFINTRKMYEEDSCPVFCPSHYRPVCAASKYKDYIYRTFNNRCYYDMVNCRTDDEFTGYTEVPLSFCQKHLMKNIFKEQLIVSNVHDYRDYD